MNLSKKCPVFACKILRAKHFDLTCEHHWAEVPDEMRRQYDQLYRKGSSGELNESRFRVIVWLNNKAHGDAGATRAEDVCASGC